MSPRWTLVVRDQGSPSIGYGADALASILAAQGIATERTPHWLGATGETTLMAGVLTDPQIAGLVPEHRGSHAPEGTVTIRLDIEGRTGLLVAGTDARGVMYGLLDLADALRCDGPTVVTSDRHWPSKLKVPHLPVRGVALSLMSRAVDMGWFLSSDFWDRYLAMLARSRLNRLTLVLGHHTPFMSPAYPFFLDVPGFPGVEVPGISQHEQQQHLEVLRHASQLAADRGIDFHLGVWQQRPWVDDQQTMLIGLDNEDLASYCRRGLAMILSACPDIAGVQFRVNHEAGIGGRASQHDADAFWEELLPGVAEAGRSVDIDLRAKGLTPRILNAALATGMPVTVSTKYWTEHMGLPYHPTTMRQAESTADPEDLDRRRRYGYADLLPRPLRYDVLYRLWSFGSNRLFVWGDPEYASRFARSCVLGGGRGFELMGPLTAKGGFNEPETWAIHADDSLVSSRWEHDRYWLYYLLLGRMGYDPATDDEVWRRELRHRFGAVAADVETAYAHASRILPTITAFATPKASAWGFWPEMWSAGSLDEYAETEPGDPGLFTSVADYVDVLGRGEAIATYTPRDIRSWLHHDAAAAMKAVTALRTGTRAGSPELTATCLDIEALANLGMFHVAMIDGALHWRLYQRQGRSDDLSLAAGAAISASKHWERIVTLTDGAYHHDLVFGRRSVHSGHWKDHLPRVSEMAADLEALCAELGIRSRSPEPPEPQRSLRHLGHRPPRYEGSGSSLAIALNVVGPGAVATVDLMYRGADHTKAWASVSMTPGNEHFRTVIGAEEIGTDVDLLYYFIVHPEEGDPLLYPGMWSDDPDAPGPYYVIDTSCTSTNLEGHST